MKIQYPKKESVEALPVTALLSKSSTPVVKSLPVILEVVNSPVDTITPVVTRAPVVDAELVIDGTFPEVIELEVARLLVKGPVETLPEPTAVVNGLEVTWELVKEPEVAELAGVVSGLVVNGDEVNSLLVPGLEETALVVSGDEVSADVVKSPEVNREVVSGDEVANFSEFCGQMWTYWYPKVDWV